MLLKGYNILIYNIKFHYKLHIIIYYSYENILNIFD